MTFFQVLDELVRLTVVPFKELNVEQGIQGSVSLSEMKQTTLSPQAEKVHKIHHYN